MGHQVNFYLTPPDVAALEEALRNIEPMIVLHSRSNAPEPRVLNNLNLAEDGKTWLFFYLVRASDLTDVEMCHVPEQGYWSIDVIKSPVVQFNRCFLDDKILRRGRVYYVEKFYGNDNEIVSKSESFRNWAKTIQKVTKSNLKKYGPDYIGKGAEVWLTTSGGVLAQN